MTGGEKDEERRLNVTRYPNRPYTTRTTLCFAKRGTPSLLPAYTAVTVLRLRRRVGVGTGCSTLSLATALERLC